MSIKLHIEIDENECNKDNDTPVISVVEISTTNRERWIGTITGKKSRVTVEALDSSRIELRVDHPLVRGSE